MIVHRDGDFVFTATPGVLQLTGLRPDQSGTYTCTADNGIGPPAVGSVEVQLQCEYSSRLLAILLDLDFNMLYFDRKKRTTNVNRRTALLSINKFIKDAQHLRD